MPDERSTSVTAEVAIEQAEAAAERVHQADGLDAGLLLAEAVAALAEAGAAVAELTTPPGHQPR